VQNNKVARADVRVRARRVVVRVEVEQTGIPSIRPITADIQDTPAGVRVHVQRKAGTHCVRSPIYVDITLICEDRAVFVIK